MSVLSDFFALAEQVKSTIRDQEIAVENQIANEFKCPVCFTYAAPPIFMCKSSHILCDRCWEKCSNCPTCRAPKEIARALTLEQIYPLVSFPCKYQGCSTRVNGACLQDHEQTCSFYPIKCPLSKSYNCTWYGAVRYAKTHLIETHRSSVYFDPSVRLVSNGFRHSSQKSYTLIFYCYDRIFRFTWEYDTTKAVTVHFNMVQLGQHNPNDSFSYTVAFAKTFPIHAHKRKSYIRQSIIYSGQSEDDDEAMPPATFSQWNVHVNDLRAFSTIPNGDLYYEVTIRKNCCNAIVNGLLTPSEYQYLHE